MNVVDSSGWLEYFADGPNADFFAPAVEKVAKLVVPPISIDGFDASGSPPVENPSQLACWIVEITALSPSTVLRMHRSKGLS